MRRTPNEADPPPAGLTTLGLFRPFRAAENLSAQRKLCLLFLDYMAEFDIAPSSPDSIRSSEASKAVLLHAFKEELRYANVHDVAAVLRWVRSLPEVPEQGAC